MNPKESLRQQMVLHNDMQFDRCLKSLFKRQRDYNEALSNLLDWFELHGKDLNPIPTFNPDMILMFRGKRVEIDGNVVFINGGSIVGAPLFFCYLELTPGSHTVDLGAGAGMRTRIDFMETVNKANN